jgi:hypothetical protein
MLPALETVPKKPASKINGLEQNGGGVGVQAL